MREQFDRCPEFIRKITNFVAKNFVLKIFLNMYNAVLTTPLEKIRQKPTRFCSTFKNDSYFCFQKKTSISSNFLNGHVESRFHNLAGKTSTEKVSLKIPKNEKWFCSLNFFFEKMSLWTCRMQFRQNSVRKILAEGQTVFAQCTKTMKRSYNFFQGKFFPQNILLDTKNAVLTTPPKKNQLKANNVRFL